MAGEDKALYLTLAPEFGGTRFGPFEGIECRLGSNKDRCHITIPEGLGVLQEHCKVLRQGPANLILTPTERSAGVYLWKGDARSPVQISTPTAVRPGDSFALVTPDGPKFQIDIAALPDDLLAQRTNKGKKNARGLTADKFASEGRRMALGRLLTIGPLQWAAQAWYFVQSGSIWQPRYIIAGAIMIGGYLTAGMASCTAFKFKADAFTATKKAETCTENLAYANNMGGSVENFQFDQLAATILGVPEIGAALKKDDLLLGKVKEEAKSIAANPDPYSWMFEETNRVEEFARFRERVDKSDSLDLGSKRLLPYLAATRKRLQGDWDPVLDSKQAESCGRGPIRLTYRQGRNLGLTAVYLDAYVQGDATVEANDDPSRTKMLARTAEAAGEPTPTSDIVSTAEILRQGDATCFYGVGDDDREDENKVVKMLNQQVGRDVDGLQNPEDGQGVVARIAKVFAADVPGVNWAGSRPPTLSFVKGTVSGSLKESPGGDWVLKKTAEIIARAMMIPCDGVLNRDKKKVEDTFGHLPDAVPCLVLNYRMSHE